MTVLGLLGRFRWDRLQGSGISFLGGRSDGLKLRPFDFAVRCEQSETGTERT